jgi:hypothetical protein
MISQIDLAEGQAKIRAQQEMDLVNERAIGRQIENARPMPIVAGPVGAAINGVSRRVIGDDAVLLARTQHLRLKKETMGQFHSRTGIGANQILTLSLKELESLYKITQLQEKIEAPKATPIPSKFRETFRADGFLDAHLVKNRMPPNVVEVGWE